MFEELLMMSDEVGAPIGLLMMLSYFRDDMPWLYDLGKTLYEAMQIGNEKKIMKALSDLQHSLNITRHHPVMDDMMMSSKESHILAMELPRMLDYYVERFQIRQETARSAQDKEKSYQSGQSESLVMRHRKS